jgi:hypothetical protein
LDFSGIDNPFTSRQGKAEIFMPEAQQMLRIKQQNLIIQSKWVAATIHDT